MATSGAATFTLTGDELVSASLRVIRVLQDGQTATTTQLTEGRQALNILLKNWQTRPTPLVVSKYGYINFTTVVGKQAYTIGPGGADVTSPRPLRVLKGSFVRNTNDNTDLIVENATREAYDTIKSKGSQGDVQKVYYFPGITIAGNLTSPSTGWGTLYLHDTSDDVTHNVYLNVQLPVFDLSTGAQEIDLPSEWLYALKWGLGAELADEYEVPDDRCRRLREIADNAVERLTVWQKSLDSVAFGEQQQAEDTYTVELKKQKGM